jgi:hypothetical protein
MRHKEAVYSVEYMGGYRAQPYGTAIQLISYAFTSVITGSVHILIKLILIVYLINLILINQILL